MMLATLLAVGLLLGFGIGVASVLAVACAIVGIVSVTRNHEFSGGAKAMWIAIILLVPVFGTVVYFAVRNDW